MIESIRKAVIEMDDEKAIELVSIALKEKTDPVDILEKGLISGMQEVATLFARKEYYVPEVLLCSEAFYAGFDIIKPLIGKSSQQSKTKVVLGVIEGDIHDIGKNIVKVMMEAGGYEVIDLGRDVPIAKFIEVVETEKPDILAISSLMTTTMVHMANIISELEQRKLRDTVKVIVGGAPVNEEFAARIKADGYSPDAPSAVKLVEKIIGG
ncbi:MAG: corrinoid protein [candidate division WOR-3 bacterium]|nr:MAG: corrinoid protein [candidate division WOR-3 bacterium]